MPSPLHSRFPITAPPYFLRSLNILLIDSVYTVHTAGLRHAATGNMGAAEDHATVHRPLLGPVDTGLPVGCHHGSWIVLHLLAS